jgi:hypothetical protein
MLPTAILRLLLVFLVLIAFVRLLLVSQLARAVFRLARRDLLWLAVHYLATFVFDISFILAGAARAGNLPGKWILPLGGLQCLFGLLGDLALVSFIHQTFYRDRKSPAWVFIGSALVIFGLGIGAIPLVEFPIFNPLIWGWLAFGANQAYRRLAGEPYVEDWIKARYRLMVTYSFMLILTALLPLTEFVLAAPVQVAALTILDILLGAAAITLQYLVWVMPESFRKWLNRKQGAPAKDQVHERALAIFNILGDAMTEGTGVSKVLALFAIRKAIGKEIQTEEPEKIEAYTISMGYEAWSALLNDPDLNVILKNSGSNVNSSEVIERAKRALIEKQSLFTMQAK